MQPLLRRNLARLVPLILGACLLPFQLNSFVPRFDLAGELLRRGEKEPVIRYLENCKLFWEREERRLDSWIRQIRTTGSTRFEKFDPLESEDSDRDELSL